LCKKEAIFLGSKLISIGKDSNSHEALFYCDAVADKDALDVSKIEVGSAAYVLSDGSLFILDSAKTWRLQ
jgi:hypothetical protein